MNQGKTDIEIAINESYWSEMTSGVKYGNLWSVWIEGEGGGVE